MLLKKSPISVFSLVLLTTLFFPFFTFALDQVYFNHDDRSSYTDPYRNILRHGKDFESIIVNFIDSAKFKVDVAVQDIDLPQVAKALVRAKIERGVKVRFVMENLYNVNMQNLKKSILISNDSNADEIIDYLDGKFNELKQFIDVNHDGVLQQSEREDRDALYIIKSNSIPLIDDTNDSSVGSSLMHHKFVIVDNAKVLVSSANFTLSDTHGDFSQPQSVGNNNALMIFENKSLANEFSNEFSFLWGTGRKGSSHFGVNKPFRDIKSINTPSGRVSVKFSPTSKTFLYSQTTNGIITQKINNAQRQIFLNLFVFSDQEISNALANKYAQRAQGKIVNIEVLVDRNFVYRDYSEVLDIFGLTMPNSTTCKYQDDNSVWPLPAPKIAGYPILTPFDKNHHKFAVIDNTILFGSHNWSPSANYSNDETFMVIENAYIAKEFIREHRRIRKNATMGITPNLMQNIKNTLKKCQTNRNLNNNVSPTVEL